MNLHSTFSLALALADVDASFGQMFIGLFLRLVEQVTFSGSQVFQK